MTSGGPQIPESPPKNPPTSATPVSTARPVPRSKRGRQPASWLAPKQRTAAPRMPKSSRSGSATTSCAESAIIATSTRFSRQNRRRLPSAGPIPCRSAWNRFDTSIGTISSATATS